MIPEIVGSIGVGLLLLAFVLNLLKRVSEQSRSYLVMNLVGALLSAWYALTGGLLPFVILEATWAAAALVRLVLSARKSPLP